MRDSPNSPAPLVLTRLSNPGLDLCIEKCGTVAELARRCGTTRQNIDQNWRRELPLWWLPEIEAATGIPKDRLRPDVFRVTPTLPREDEELLDECERIGKTLTEDDICKGRNMHKIVLLRRIVLRLAGDLL